MANFFKFRRDCSLQDFTLVLPTVSVGNVPQLTIDLLITSYNFEKLATLWHPAIVSSVGADPYVPNGPEICTACELYINENLKVALLQLRSTLEPKLAKKFFFDLKSSLVDLNVKKVVILTSSFDHELHVVGRDKFFYISNGNVSDLMKSVNVKPKEVEFNGKYFVHGSGFAVKLFEVFEDSFDCTVLIKYVSEGDNRPDAISTVEILTKIVDNLKSCQMENIQFPCSWSCVFGGPPPLGMY